eukprot:scaffold20493_cov125-Isochrysis_galbana.AAC.4
MGACGATHGGVPLGGGGAAACAGVQVWTGCPFRARQRHGRLPACGLHGLWWHAHTRGSTKIAAHSLRHTNSAAAAARPMLPTRNRAVAAVARASAGWPAPRALATRAPAATEKPNAGNTWRGAHAEAAGGQSRPAWNSADSHPSHSAMVITAAGTPNRSISNQPRHASRKDARLSLGHVRTCAPPAAASARGVAARRMAACTSSARLIASAAPSNPMARPPLPSGRTSSRKSPACATDASTVTAAGSRLAPCAIRKAERSCTSVEAGSAISRKRAKRAAKCAVCAGWPSASRSRGSAANHVGVINATTSNPCIASCRSRRTPTRSGLDAPKACAMSAEPPNPDPEMKAVPITLQNMVPIPAPARHPPPSGSRLTTASMRALGANCARRVSMMGHPSRRIARASAACECAEGPASAGPASAGHILGFGPCPESGASESGRY